MSELQPCDRFMWERIVRRCQIPGPTKLVAFVLAQYANQKGQNIRPGTEVVSAVCGMSLRVAKRHMKTLRDIGLIEKMSHGGGPTGKAATYRLTTPDDLMERVALLDPDEKTGATVQARVTKANSSPLGGPSSDDLGAELGPFQNELVPLGVRTGANDPPVTSNDAHHHPEHPLDHPIRDFGRDVTSTRETAEDRLIHLPPNLDLRAAARAARKQATG